MCQDWKFFSFQSPSRSCATGVTGSNLWTVARFSSSSWFMLWSGSRTTGSLMLSNSLLPWPRATSISSYKYRDRWGKHALSEQTEAINAYHITLVISKNAFLYLKVLPSFFLSCWCVCSEGWLWPVFHLGVQFLPAQSQMTAESVPFSLPSVQSLQ